MRNDEEEDADDLAGHNAAVNKRIVKNTKVKIIEEFKQSIQSLGRQGAAGTAIVTSNEDKEDQVKTLKEVLEEREEQLKDIE